MEKWEMSENELGRYYRRSDFPDLEVYETARFAMPIDVSKMSPRIQRQYAVWTLWRDRDFERNPPAVKRDANGYDEEEAAYWKNRHERDAIEDAEEAEAKGKKDGIPWRR